MKKLQNPAKPLNDSLTFDPKDAIKPATRFTDEQLQEMSLIAPGLAKLASDMQAGRSPYSEAAEVPSTPDASG